MKLSTILPATLFAVFVHANDLLDVQKQCNNGYLATDNYTRPRISEASCVLTATRDAPGFDIHKQTGKSTLFFFFDSFVCAKKNNKDISIRFVVYENDKDYNAIQTIVQTAYATRVTIEIIFDNPAMTNCRYDYVTFLSKRKTESECYVNEAFEWKYSVCQLSDSNNSVVV